MAAGLDTLRGMNLDLLIRGGTVINSELSVDADLGVRGGRIVAIGDLKGLSAAETLDASGLHILPGLIDTQVHFREPGLEHKEDLESGTRAALYGGVTTVLEMPNTDPLTTSADALADKLRRAAGRAWVNYGFFVGAAQDNLDQLGHLERLPGTPGIKIFMGSSTGALLVDRDDDLRQVLRSVQGPCPIHAEDEPRLVERRRRLGDQPHVSQHPWARDAEAARLATQRILAISAETGTPVHILHVSTAAELPLIAEAKRRGLGVTAEVTPQHLSLNDEAYETLGTRLQMNPPVRDEATRQALWHAVTTGLFDVFGSDHAPHTVAEKERSYPQSPSGMPGVQTMLPVLLDHVAAGRLPLGLVVRMLAENPARLYRMPGKGRIALGCDADLTLVDLNARFTVSTAWLQSKCGWSPFEGQTLTGRPVHTFVGGVWSLRDGQHFGPAGGQVVQFLPRP